MNLPNSLEKQGEFLFRYRGFFPILLFFIVIPFIFLRNNDFENNFIVFNFSLFLTVLGFLLRFYTVGTTLKGTSGRNTKVQVASHLNSTGIYSVLRHPLYLGNLLIWNGVSIFSYNIYFVCFINFFFFLYYRRIMMAEEYFLRNKFDKEFLSWSSRTPRIIPSFKNYIRTETYFSFKSILRREYAGSLSAVIGYLYIDSLRILKEQDEVIFQDYFLNIKILCVTIFFVLIIRQIKHSTDILLEKDRS